MHVVDPVPEVGEEAHRVQVLSDEVGGVEVQPEPLAVADRFEGAFCRPVVVGDLGRVYFQREAHPTSSKTSMMGFQRLAKSS